MISVMVVDDRPAVCEGLRKMIPWERIGAEIVCQAGDGREAWAMAVEKQPDVVITDVRMPHMDGLELSRRINELLPDTRIVILSAYDEFAYAQNAMRYGVTDYILKPIDRDKIDRISDILSRTAEQFEERRRHYSLLYDSRLEHKAALLLKTTDADGLADFFRDDFPALEDLHSHSVKELCVKLTALFFDTLQLMGVQPEQLGADKEETWRELLACKSKTSMKAITESLYSSAARMLQSRKSSNSEAIVEHLKHYLDNHFDDPNLSVYTMASENGLSANYTSVIFRQVTGTNISTYLTALRMAKAKTLLAQPQYMINDIARMTGYTDPHYFAKAFKKSENITPTHYRNLLLGAGREG